VASLKNWSAKCRQFGGKAQRTRAFGANFVSKNGAGEGIRTPDPRFTKALLYP
jgi:hypothetical protein